MKKIFCLTALYLSLVACNNDESVKPGDADSTQSKTDGANLFPMIPVPPELTVTADQVNAMHAHYNSAAVDKTNTSILGLNVGYLKTVIDGLGDVANVELIFGGYRHDDFLRRQPLYSTVPEEEVVDRSCIIFRNPSTKKNYDITYKLCPPPVGPCDVSFNAELKGSAKSDTSSLTAAIGIPAGLQITAANVRDMLAHYNSGNVTKSSAGILTVNVGHLRTVIDRLPDADALQLVFGGYTYPDFTRRQPVYPATPRGEVLNVACVVLRNDATRQNFDITVKLCPPPVGPCDISFFQDIKKQESKK